MVQDKTSPRKHQGYRGKENDTPVQDMSQALDKKCLGGTFYRNHTQGVERKVETITIYLTFKFKRN